MKKMLPCFLLLSILAIFLSVGSDRVTQANGLNPQPDLPIMTPPAPDIAVLTLLDVESFSCDDVIDVPVSECQALVDLYESTNGVEWIDITNWLISARVDDWYGITVFENHVTIIEMNGNSLSGEIPDTISQLQYLIELCLTGNSVSGTLPEAISQMNSLERISLDYNQVSGSLPEWLSLMPKLTKISLGHNKLSGTIPASLGDLPALQKLEFHDNDINGELPESLGNLTSLINLIIYDNPIEGKIPIPFTNLTNLDYFYFYGTELCEPTTPEFLVWKATILEYQGTNLFCMDYHQFLPIVCR